MAVSPAQRASYAADHLSKIPFHSSPRHLAGPGDPRHVTHALLAAGWTITSAPGDPRLVLTGPDHARHRLRFDPLKHSYWQIDAADRSWYASFDRMVPAEIVAGFTDRLIGGPRRKDLGPWQRMTRAGWTVERRPNGTGKAHSSGSHRLWVESEQRYEDDPTRLTWRIQARPDYDRPLVWRMWINGIVPEHLLDGLVEQLVATTPVVRGMYEYGGDSVRQEPSGLSPEQVVEAYAARLEAVRKLVRAERGSRRLTTSLPAPAPPRTAPSPVPHR